MNLLRKLRNYYFYCGIEKDEYNAVKKDAYVSNYKVWKILHFLMAAAFGLLYLWSFADGLMAMNRWIYLIAFLYSAVVIFVFFRLKKDSLVAQLLIYLSMSLLFLFAAVVNLNKAEYNATAFIVFLVLLPMFMIDKPYFMTIETGIASAVFLIWMRGVKTDFVWRVDLVNVIAFMVVGNYLNIIANSLRIREFVLTRQIRIQKDTDEMTGLKNKGAMMREIDEYLADSAADKGLMFILDVDRFKAINDTFGHDVGDSVIVQLGRFLKESFTGGEIAGRFGGDEFILFIKNANDIDTARETASRIIAGVSENVVLPGGDQKVSITVGIAAYSGQEKHFYEIFKKADIALYDAKNNSEKKFCVYG